MVNLYEYQNKETLSESFEGIEKFLDGIWSNREKYSYYDLPENIEIENQQFIQFLHKTNEIKSNKYVGVIHFNGQKINLLPKIFYNPELESEPNQINQIHNHILWWLSYCRKIKFPNYRTALSGQKSDFFEVLIYLFSKYTRELLSNSIFQRFEEVSGQLNFIKGRLNTSGYINQNIGTGQWHKLNCTYDSFVLDNEFNQIVKYVATLLFGVTTSQDSKRNLREILFILDEVSDVRATASQCLKIKFNPFHGEFETVRDYCHLFLSNYVSFNYKNDLKLFAFLLPMEYVFEDFVFGFIDKELPDIAAKAQKSDTYLDETKLFNLVPDLHLTIGLKSIIADTKYKIVYSDERDPKKGISQNDLYQLLAYAVRFKIDELILFYPNTVKAEQEKSFEIFIQDTFADNRKIQIRAFQIPVLNRNLLSSDLDYKISLDEIFETTKWKLKESLERILFPSIPIL
ncbi:MAG TPA: hypothetical protein VFG10_07185 [Saprospiraceae bacterium]|nr:hypothetical protein [Saprospiraceae bacterium]